MNANREWIEHDGSGMPKHLTNNTKVQVTFDDGSVTEPMPAGFWDARPSNWENHRGISEIVAYRVMKP